MLGILLAGILIPVILVGVGLTGNRYLPRLARYAPRILLAMGVVDIAGGVIRLSEGPKELFEWFGVAWSLVLGSSFIWLARRMRAARNGPVA
jgi:hypothetical protein